MKAVILETRKNKAVALADDGRVNEVSNKNYKIGQTIEMERNVMTKMNRKYRNIAAGVAASLVILLGAGTAYAYNTPVANISLDVNPSVTYTVNAFNKVIHVDKSNPDAEFIFETIEWDGENINQVIEDTILALKEKNYLESDKWYEEEIVIGVNATSKDKENQLILAIKNELAKIVAEETDKEIDTAELDLDESVIGIGAERVADAAKLSEDLGFKVTPGKLNLVQKLNSSYTELGNEDLNTTEASVWLRGSVKEIMSQIKENRLALKGKTVEESGTDLLDDDSDVDGIENNNGNGNGKENGNVKNNGNTDNRGNSEGNVDDGDDDDIDDLEDDEDDEEEDDDDEDEM